MPPLLLFASSMPSTLLLLLLLHPSRCRRLVPSNLVVARVWVAGEVHLVDWETIHDQQVVLCLTLARTLTASTLWASVVLNVLVEV